MLVKEILILGTDKEKYYHCIWVSKKLLEKNSDARYLDIDLLIKEMHVRMEKFNKKLYFCNKKPIGH